MKIYNKTFMYTGGIIFFFAAWYPSIAGLHDNIYFDLMMVAGIMLMLLGLKKPKEINS